MHFCVCFQIDKFTLEDAGVYSAHSYVCFQIDKSTFEEDGVYSARSYVCFQIDKSTLEDDGVYQCTVKNAYGSVRSECVKVSIATSEWACFAPASCESYVLQILFVLCFLFEINFCHTSSVWYSVLVFTDM